MFDVRSPPLPTVLAALSLRTDLANDQPSGSALRTANIGLLLAAALGLPAGG